MDHPQNLHTISMRIEWIELLLNIYINQNDNRNTKNRYLPYSDYQVSNPAYQYRCISELNNKRTWLPPAIVYFGVDLENELHTSIKE